MTDRKENAKRKCTNKHFYWWYRFDKMNNLQNARSFSFLTWLTLQIIGNDIQLIRIMKPKYKDAFIDEHIMKLNYISGWGPNTIQRNTHYSLKETQKGAYLKNSWFKWDLRLFGTFPSTWQACPEDLLVYGQKFFTW